MKTLRATLARVFGLFDRDRRDSELQAELASHVQMHIDDYVRSGLSPEEARRRALLKLGGVEKVTEAYREQRGLPFLETLVQLHTNHGFWHEFMPANGWSLLSLLGSVGLFLLGATGIYLWFCHHEERVIGFVILAVGLVYSLTTLVLSRIA